MSITKRSCTLLINPVKSLCLTVLFPAADAHDGTVQLTDANVEKAVTFIQELAKSRRLRKKKIFQANGITLNVGYIALILNHGWLGGDVSTILFHSI